MTRHEDIERYLSNAMSDEERLAFEEELQSDPDLREETNLYASTVDSLRRTLQPDAGEQALRDKLERNRTYFSSENDKKRQTGRVVSIMRWAAAAAVLAAIAIWAPWANDPLSEYGTITMPSLVERGADSAGRIAEAAKLFNEKDYEEALPLLDAGVLNRPDDMFLLFFRGVTHLHTGNPEKARLDLRKVFESKSVYRFDAAYFIGLSYLDENSAEDCRTWLEKIPPETQAGKKAEVLLETLK